MSNHEYSNPERYNGEMERYAKQIENELNNSAVVVNWGSIQGTLSAQTDLQTALNSKADLNTTNTALGTKADTTTVNTQLATKTDKTYVDNADSLKADKTYVDSGLSGKVDTSTFNTTVNGKVDTTTYNTGMSTKADKTYVDTQDNLKLDKTGGTMTGNILFDVTTEKRITDSATKWGFFINGTGLGFYDWNTSKSIMNYTSSTSTMTMSMATINLSLSDVTTKTLTVSSGATTVIQKMQNNNGTTAYIGASGKNALQSGNSGFTAVQNFSIEGYNGLAIPTLTLNATATSVSGTLTATGNINTSGDSGAVSFWENGVSLANKYAPLISVDIPFTNLTLQNGATVNNTRTPRYARRNGVVYVEGEILQIANGTIIATLPVGCRPSYPLNFMCAMSKSSAIEQCLISVGTNGTITIIYQTTGATSGHVLNQIQFIAEG